MSLGNKLRILREGHGYTQEQISHLLYIERSAYSNYENDKRIPSYSCIAAIADFYSVKTDYLIRDNFSGNPDLGTDAEKRMLTAFRLLDPSTQKELYEYIQYRLKNQQRHSS